MDEVAPELKSEPSFVFGSGFLEDHAGHIISDPGVAVIELIANSYDAGATEVRISWPESRGCEFQICDNGAGMTPEEFNRRWKTLKYNRMNEQGPDVEFPPGVRARRRKAFGQSGKGRHGAFCFSDQYTVTTSRSGKLTRATVSRSKTGVEPFRCEIECIEENEGHGTTISGLLTKHAVEVDKLIEIVGSKFAVDPEFSIFVNGQSVALTSLNGVTTETCKVDDQDIAIHIIESGLQERNTRFRGITWWVQRRMVGRSSWSGLDDKGAILDGRTSHARKYSFIIEADCLKPDVKPDWSEFYESPRSLKVRDAVVQHVTRRLNDFLSTTRKERKRQVIEQHRRAIGELPVISKRVVGQFIDDVQQSCPTISEGDLSRTVEILTKLEQSRNGYDLLENLSKCSPDDLDTWNGLIAHWNSNHAEAVLNELGTRIKLIDDLTQLIHDISADELHDLQPLFARGLWIFGPEFESADFTSNRGMATVIRKLLGGTTAEVAVQRPDIVMLPDSSIGAYAADSFDELNEPNGFRSVVIVELKKGGFPLTVKEVRQADDYVREIRKAKLVQDKTRITAFVLGATIEDAEPMRIGDSDYLRIIPMPYDVVLRKAHARTFNLKSKIEKLNMIRRDDDVEEALASDDQGELF